jgi:hypothetical protein
MAALTAIEEIGKYGQPLGHHQARRNRFTAEAEVSAFPGEPHARTEAMFTPEFWEL